jgi:DHA2 family multidrug resistance protein
MPPQSTTSTFIAIYTAIFFAIFSFTLTIMGSIYIAGDLGGSNDIAIYTVCLYGIGNAIGIPLGRSLSHNIGTVRQLCICLHLFALFSFLCGLSTDFYMFLTFRFFQGIVVGPIYALANQLFAGLVPKEKKSLFTTISLGLFSTLQLANPLLCQCDPFGSLSCLYSHTAKGLSAAR